MARPGLNDNRKFRSLIQRLRLPRPYVRGLLEVMWDVGHACGLPLLGSPDDVEAAAEWPGERCVLFAALSEVGFVCQFGCGCSTDQDEQASEWGDKCWRIHDYWSNAPDYVLGRRRQERLRAKHRVARQSRDNNVTVTHSSATPAPAPAPAPAPKEDTTGQAQQFELIPTADPPKPPVMVYACQGKPDQWELSEDQLTEWAGDYPALGREGLLDECRKASAWLKANHLKTSKGMKRFLVNWFSSTVNRKGASHGSIGNTNRGGYPQRGLVENLTL
jgi:hypothetical protein